MAANECAANAAGQDVSGNGCTPPKGTFYCGTTPCAEGTHFCWHYYSDTYGPDEYTCKLTPPECPSPVSCDCLKKILNLKNCQLDAGGNAWILDYGS